MKILLEKWHPKNKFCKILKEIVRVIAIIIAIAFLILPFVNFEQTENDIFRWIWIVCAVSNLDIFWEYKKAFKTKVITPMFTGFSILALAYMYNYWALLPLQVVICVSIVMGILELVISVAVYKTIRFTETTEIKELPPQTIQGFLLGGLYICALVLFVLGHYVSKNMIFVFGGISAVMLSCSVLICIGNGVSHRKNIVSAISFIIDVLSLLALVIYLINLIPEEGMLQEIVLEIVASVIGGALTLAGVAWTIQKNNIDRKADEKKKAKPIFTFAMCEKKLTTTENNKVCLVVEERNLYENNVFARIENSEQAVFSIERIYHDKKWWKSCANNVVLPGSSVYLDFKFTDDKYCLFMEIKDSLGNLYYYYIKVFDRIKPADLKTDGQLSHTILGLQEMTFDEVEKIIKARGK